MTRRVVSRKGKIMTSQDTREATNLARRIDHNLEKICRAQFGHVLTLDEWKALPFALRRELDKQARQQANHSGIKS
jgi:hypothetical protein